MRSPPNPLRKNNRRTKPPRRLPRTGSMPDGVANPESNLPQDVAVLQGMIRELLTTVREQQRRIDHLVHQVHQLTKRLYGPRADQLHPNQPSLFDEPSAGD